MSTMRTDLNNLSTLTLIEKINELEAQLVAVPTTEYLQFLSDVMTAAGLVTHGKKSKALGERLSDGVGKYRDVKNNAVQIAELVANLQTQRREYLALQAQLADAQKDAERYRWLRNRPEDQDIFIGVDSHKYPSRWSLLGEYADYVIDAEMKDTIDAARAGEVT